MQNTVASDSVEVYAVTMLSDTRNDIVNTIIECFRVQCIYLRINYLAGTMGLKVSHLFDAR